MLDYIQSIPRRVVIATVLLLMSPFILLVSTIAYVGMVLSIVFDTGYSFSEED